MTCKTSNILARAALITTLVAGSLFAANAPSEARERGFHGGHHWHHHHHRSWHKPHGGYGWGSTYISSYYPVYGASLCFFERRRVYGPYGWHWMRVKICR